MKLVIGETSIQTALIGVARHHFHLPKERVRSLNLLVPLPSNASGKSGLELPTFAANPQTMLGAHRLQQETAFRLKRQFPMSLPTRFDRTEGPAPFGQERSEQRGVFRQEPENDDVGQAVQDWADKWCSSRRASASPRFPMVPS